MKIIIVGGGISGLSTYLFLQKYLSKVSSHSIKIYEKHHSRLNLTTENETSQDGATFEELSTSTAIVGGGLGVSPNGMRLLKELSPELRDAVEKQGYRAENFVFRSSRGWRLSAVQTGDKRIEEGEEFCVATSRHGLWECLRDHVVQQAGDDVLVYKKIAEVRCGEEGKKACVVFEDGSVEEADLIIGADGVRSVVKKGIFGVDKEGKEEFAPVYENLLGVGGFIPTDSHPPIPEKAAMIFTFGPNGFFGYSSSGKGTMWWSTCEAADIPPSTRISLEDMRSQLKARHGKWKDPVLQAIVEKADVDSIYPVWTTPELPYWGKQGCVLVGDAAHALQPTSGQGSSQALEDAKTFAICLEKFLSRSNASAEGNTSTLNEALELTNKVFYQVRNPRINKIVERTKLMSNRKKEQGIAEEMMTCFFLWLVGKVPSVGKMLLGDVNKELYYWDVNKEIDEVMKKIDSPAK